MYLAGSDVLRSFRGRLFGETDSQQLADSTSTRGCPKAAARVISTRSRNPWLDFSLFRNFQRVIHLDAEVSDRTFQFGMAKQ